MKKEGAFDGVVIKGRALMVVVFKVLGWGERWLVIGRGRERLRKKGLIGGNWVIRLD